MATACVLALLLGLGLPIAHSETRDELTSQVRAAETAFAKTMADRDHAAFASYLADEAIFFGQGVLRGKAAIAAGWKAYFEGAAAPFSWEPRTVEVLDSGTQAVERAGARPRRPADRHLQLHLAPRGRRQMARRVRQGLPVRSGRGAVNERRRAGPAAVRPCDRSI